MYTQTLEYIFLFEYKISLPKYTPSTHIKTNLKWSNHKRQMKNPITFKSSHFTPHYVAKGIIHSKIIANKASTKMKGLNQCNK